MASRLTEAHIEAQRRLREATAEAVELIWNSLPGYTEENLDDWLSLVLPVVRLAERQSSLLTQGFIARTIRRPVGVNPDPILRGLRNGIPPEEVYARALATTWTSLANGATIEEASAAGLARAVGSARMDVQMTMRATAQAVQDAVPEIRGYTRVADAGACEFCALVDGAFVYSASAAPLHNNCGCGLEPVIRGRHRQTPVPDGVAVHEHGELGPVLGDPHHNFTSQSDL